MKEKFIQWIPIEGNVSEMYIQGVLDDREGFRILVGNNEKLLRILFQTKIQYRVTQESYIWETWGNFEKDKLGKIFYMVENSLFIEEFKRISCGAYDDLELIHYAIYSISDCIDIITDQKPTIEWLW